MDNDSVVGSVIMAPCCGLCAMTFLGIGIWAEKTAKPMGFWSGTTVDPEKVLDLKEYNHANAVMWKSYSVPYWLAFLLSCLGFLGEIYVMAAAVLLGVACVPGFVFLIWRYRVIERKYIKP